MSNLARMVALADEFFGARADPDQLVVDADVMEKLRGIHPSTLSEACNEDGPIAWVLLIPTTHQRMERFVRGELGERQLLEIPETGPRFEALYLCSALVLPEYRGKGIARRLAADAIEAMVEDFPIKELFVWGFSTEGSALAKSLARSSGLPLYERRGAS